MALTEGPLLFLTDGTNASLAGLGPVATFAATTDWRLTVVYLFDELAQPTNTRSIDHALAALPVRQERTNILATHEADLSRTLADVGAEPSGILALPPQRRRFLPGDAFGRLPGGWRPPLLVVPPSARYQPIARVLFPADLAPRSAAAFDEAIALCGALDAELHVLHVFGDDRRLPTEVDLASRRAARNPRELFEIDWALIAGMVQRAASEGVHASAHTAEGRAHTHILRYAATNEINLIFMPSHGPRSMEDIVLGTTTARVLRAASVPVITLRSGPLAAGISASA